MVTIYCIEDINDLKYVGSTKQSLNKRLRTHITDKKRKSKITSSKLNLEYCSIYSLENCNESNRKEREKYWINKIDCVNKYKLDYDDKSYHINYREKNKETIALRNKKWNDSNKYYEKERWLFRSKKVVNGCYEFIKMLEQY